MKLKLGKPLSKKEMKAIKGGRFPGCAGVGQSALAYTDGCCAGLHASPIFCEA